MSGSVVGRLRRRAEFLAAAKGVRVHRPLFTLQVRVRSEDGGARLGLTVTRKAGKSVERNRIRRRLRAAAGDAFAAVPPRRAGIDYVVVARRAVLQAGYRDLVQELAAALSRAPAKLAKASAPRSEHGHG